MDFLKEIVKEIGDEYTKLASDIDETEEYVDTGSYIFNGLVSGSIFGGVSRNKITAIAGESSTGKTFFSLAVVKNFLDSNPDGYCLYFDTEAAVNKSLLESRGIDLSRPCEVAIVVRGRSRTMHHQFLPVVHAIFPFPSIIHDYLVGERVNDGQVQ